MTGKWPKDFESWVQPGTLTMIDFIDIFDVYQQGQVAGLGSLHK